MELGQYVLPEWGAEALVEQFYGRLGPHEKVVDVGAGTGAILKAIPRHVEAVGVEIDPAMADYCAENSGRPVIVGDFCQVELPFRPTLFVSNPPFKRRLVDKMLRKMHALLPDGSGRVGMLLPAYMFQWAKPTLGWAELFTMEQTMVPREIFPNLLRPLVFVQFHKERIRKLFGFALYQACADVSGFSKPAKLILVNGKPGRSAWRAVIDEALSALGGKGTLAEIYDFVSSRRPTANVWWKQQIRKQLRRGYVNPAPATYALAA